MTSGRYAIGTWRTVATVAHDEYRIGRDIADMVDTRTGDTFRDGAERVTVRGVDGFRTRTFRGESAWSDAERYAMDALFAARRQHGH